MPAIVSVKVVSARDLPVMDRSSELTDAFVEVRLGQNTQRTEICKKTLNPIWDSSWFNFNVDDEEFQQEPLTFKIMDYDQYSAHDAIGRVYLLLSSFTVTSLDGWFPIYDTLHGIRGEINIKVTIEVLKDSQHMYKHSSSEVVLFTGQSITEGYSIVSEHGFVEELVVNIDPEYQWIDKIRPPRASNESRQQTFMKLSGELQRKIRRKALELGGNAIIGFTQSFDLEGEYGIVVRGIGTCVTMATQHPTSPYIPQSDSLQFIDSSRPLEDPIDISQQQERYYTGIPITRVSSSESDTVYPPSSPLKGSGLDNIMLGTSIGSGGMPQLSLFEFPFYTLTSLPAGLITHIGGVVSSRSVKLLDDINNPDEPETRDAWWNEIRSEIRSHCCVMYCNAVIGYTETTSICDDLCVLSGTGTSVIINGLTADNKINDITREDTVHDDSTLTAEPLPCSPCHVPFGSSKCPFNMQLFPCSLCRSKQVSSIILSTTDPPNNVPIRGQGTLIQARICKLKRRGKGEDNASNISSILPFVEYGLHNRLIAKLKVKGMNSMFGLKISVTVGDTMVIGIATGTGLFLEPLPPPSSFLSSFPQTDSGSSGLTTEMIVTLNKLQDENKKRYMLDKPSIKIDQTSLTVSPPRPSTPEQTGVPVTVGGDDIMDLQLNTILVDVEESLLKEEDMTEVILDNTLPQGFHLSTLSYIPSSTSLNEYQTIDYKVLALTSRQYIDGRHQSHDYQCSTIFSKLIQTLLFRVRHIHPCIITNIMFNVDLPEDDEIQVSMVAMVSKIISDEPFPLYVAPPTLINKTRHKQISQSSNSELLPDVFILSCHSDVIGYNIIKHVGIINLFLIRETTSLKELGGMSSFLHTFISEAHNIALSQVIACNGHGLTDYTIRQCIVMEHSHKNQGQCLLNISGNAVQLQSNEVERTSELLQEVSKY